ncbi:protein of unknown function [Modicisalibacter ilicicola DSM 19980]|uniref:2-oxoadipate dioxygenase/decarboxylase n=1 Tax=Modicisalibacter ilicicola DSM 19980 TaxID=1121942 RepID=A0A1M4XAF4_9GAMM|nr:DUF1338 family protein [Halomonas ilicicola]SHE90430.1 protein of unknown function [Halomonas ilicicola DSM 19980]
MQREEFLQQLWLDYIHMHPELGGSHPWARCNDAEYMVILTLNIGPFSADALQPALSHFGYRRMGRFAMADRGLLVILLAPPDDGAWLLLGEFQAGALIRQHRRQLQDLVDQAQPQDCRGQNLLCRGRPWPMPDWTTYRSLEEEHPLAAWLAVMGPRLHHAGFDCERLGSDLVTLDRSMQQAGLIGSVDTLKGVFPISPLLHYRFYPTCPQRLPFALGDEHRVATGGIAFVQKSLAGAHERAVELLLPHHTRCEIA